MEEKKLTDEEVVKALERCAEDGVCEVCPYFIKGIDCAYQRREKDYLDLIRRLQTEKEQLEAAVKLHVMDIDNLYATLEKRVAEVYPEFMSDYRIMREELEESNAREQELQKQAAKNYNNGFDKGVKAAVEKMRAYLPPRDVDDYPDAIPSHWQLDEVLRQLIGCK